MTEEQRAEVRDLVETLIELYEHSESTCISEYSSTTMDKDRAALKRDIAEYRERLALLLAE